MPSDTPATPRDRYPSIHPRNYYDDLGEGEWDRLEAGPKATLELENTVAYLEAHLPDGGHVLDAGGAAGRYAIWLAERGHDVTLTDISDAQLDLARETVREHDVADRVDVLAGDVRDLPLEDDRFDAVCCLGGPLSHVVEEAERHHAVRELRRVAAPGAPTLVSVMGLVAVLQRLVQVADEFEQGVRQLPGLLETGTYSAELLAANDVAEPTFVECHFFRAAELRDLLAANGFEVEMMVGLEGIASNFEDPLRDADDDAVQTVREVVSDPELREDPTVADLSNHILAVATVGPGDDDGGTDR